MILWVWHQPEYVAPRVADTGDSLIRSVGILGVGRRVPLSVNIRYGDLFSGFQSGQRHLVIGEKPSLAVSDRHVEQVLEPLSEDARAGRVGPEVYPSTFEMGTAIACEGGPLSRLVSRCCR